MQKIGLFSPIKINSMELSNRVIMSPMFTNSAAPGGFVSKNTIKHYVDRARSGVGLIMTEHTSVSSKYIHPGLRLQISKDEHINGLKKLVAAVHDEGCKIGLQLAHSIYGLGLKPHDLTNKECYDIIDDFIVGARRAYEAGFDAIELHYAHTYTMADFISRRTNLRTDEFGGDIYGRMFIHLEILKKVRELVGPDYPVFARISAEEFVLGGNTIVQSRIFATELVKYGVDCMDVSAGVRFDDAPVKGYSDQRGKPTIEYPDGPNVYLAEDIKKHVNVPVITVGKLGNPEFAEDVIASGRADMIALARPLIADPMWVRKVQDNRFDRITECLYCTECLYERHDPAAYIHCMRYTCQNACPANVEVPLYLDFARRGMYKEAYQVIQNENPLVLTCGRVCNHPCESMCNRVKIDEPLAIRGIKRFITDTLLEKDGRFPLPEMAKPNGKRVAVVGSGPSGLSCAFYLQKKGYSVTVYEALPLIGGMLAVGLPPYRLPREKFDKELALFREMGIKLITNTRVGKDVSISELRDKGYMAVYLAVGDHNDRKLGVDGEDAANVLSGVSFLRSLNLGEDMDLRGKAVTVVGGGNVAIDCARTAIRLGASKVALFCLEKNEEMPAHPDEVREGKEEGLLVFNGWGPKYIGLNSKNEADKVVFKECRAVFDTEGRFNPSYDEDNTMEMPADMVICAIGQALSREVAVKDQDIVDIKGNIIKAAYCGTTSTPWLFAGGDCTTGPDSVVNGINRGKQAASSIDRYLGGDGQVIPVKTIARELTKPIDENACKREEMPVLQPSERCGGFCEVEKGFTEDQVKREAGRCLRCDVLKVSRL
jgi:NADPH-dependent glutamate synthase beta subunit-like oxidoreductase/2,4-dienoyl-CoA reductase-like NADH-dependent reductase (Old Yellow Enzyme family)